MLKSQNRYGFSPITRRPDYVWPGGKRLAVYFALGVEEYVFGEGMTEDIFPGAPKPDFANTSWRDYGNRVGGFRLIDKFADRSIPLSLLLNTEVYDHAPDLMTYARDKGCEIIAHGLTNSDTLAGRSPEDERAYLAAVAARIAKEEGAPPAGWSSPWLSHTATTPESLKACGYSYVLDLGMDDQPVWLRSDNGPLLCVPYALELNDSTTIIGRQASAGDFAAMIIDQFDEMLDQSAEQPLVMAVAIHSFISGQPFRLRTLTRALDHIAGKSDQCWLATPGRIASHILADPSLAV